MKTLEEMLLQRLDKWRPSGPRETLELAHPDSGWKVRLCADSADALACRLWEVQLDRTAPLPAEVSLAERAARTAGRVTGLLEPLRLVEIDSPRGVAQLRSSGPQQRGEDLFYYEVVLHAGGAASLRRFHASRNNPTREQVAFVLTHEALVKLVADLTA
jgi:hypothetical protein